jgi:hypothetical protein
VNGHSPVDDQRSERRDSLKVVCSLALIGALALPAGAYAQNTVPKSVATEGPSVEMKAIGDELRGLLKDQRTRNSDGVDIHITQVELLGTVLRVRADTYGRSGALAGSALLTVHLDQLSPEIDLDNALFGEGLFVVGVRCAAAETPQAPGCILRQPGSGAEERLVSAGIAVRPDNGPRARELLRLAVSRARSLAGLQPALPSVEKVGTTVDAGLAAGAARRPVYARRALPVSVLRTDWRRHSWRDHTPPELARAGARVKDRQIFVRYLRGLPARSIQPGEVQQTVSSGRCRLFTRALGVSRF